MKIIYIRGYLLVLTLVFGAVFLTLISSFVGYLVTQHRAVTQQYFKEQALSLAESGLEYYRWRLAHYPQDTSDGTGLPGPYIHEYKDPEGGRIGEFSLSINGSASCGEVYAMDVESTGRVDDAPNVTRTLLARYAQPTVAEYAYIINANVWAGDDRVIIGPYHSNGVVRMDGSNNSLVTSGQASWVCDGSVSCAPKATGQSVTGVYGDGAGSAFWRYPTPPINFTGLTVDLAVMLQKAKNGGVYIPSSGAYGYRLVLKTNDTFDLYRVTSTYNYWGYSLESGDQMERHVISASSYIGNYHIPNNCGLVFVEDKVWLEGSVSGKVTIASADIDSPGVDPSIIINNNVLYASDDAGLLAIAEKDILIGLVVPDSLTLNGIFIAQNGHFGRNHYTSSGSYDVESMHDSYVKRSLLTIHGTIVSNGRVGTKWTSGATYLSGFNARYNSYDRNLVSSPPPLTPRISDTYRFLEWREID